MAATYQLISAHGATVTTTETNIASIVAKFKRADNDTDDNLNPNVHPSSGTGYSWRKSIRLSVTVSPDVNISNVRFYHESGSWGTGRTMYAHTKPVANYDQATAADASAQIATDGGSAVTDASTFTSVSPLVVNAGEMLANPATGYGTQDLVEMQLAVTSSSSPGIAGPVTYVWLVDEV